MRLILRAVEGPHWGEEFPFDPGQISLMGRDRKHGGYALIRDAKVSRGHVLIEATAETLRIRDLGSKHATQINGRAVATAEMVEGDVMTIGETKLLLRSEGAAATTTTFEEPDVFVPSDLGDA